MASCDRNEMLLLACGSRSMRSVLRPRIASAAERFTAVVVLPTPPFWLAIATIMWRCSDYLVEGGADHSRECGCDSQFQSHITLQIPRRAKRLQRSRPGIQIELGGGLPIRLVSPAWALGLGLWDLGFEIPIVGRPTMRSPPRVGGEDATSCTCRAPRDRGSRATS